MTDLVVSPDLWISRIFPEGLIERWLVQDGTIVRQNEPVAELRVEGLLVRLAAPVAGRVFITAKANSIIEPGSVIGQVRPL